jgi:hypothetical protein
MSKYSFENYYVLREMDEMDDVGSVQPIFSQGGLKVFHFPATHGDPEAGQKRKKLLYKYGQGSKWDTANPAIFRKNAIFDPTNFYSNKPFYIAHIDGMPAYQWITKDGGEVELYDRNDRVVDEVPEILRDVMQMIKK